LPINSVALYADGPTTAMWRSADMSSGSASFVFFSSTMASCAT